MQGKIGISRTGKMMPKMRVTRCELPPVRSSKNDKKSSLYPVAGYIHRTASADRIVPTAAKKVSHPRSPSAPIFSSAQSNMPASSPTKRSTSSRVEGTDLTISCRGSGSLSGAVCMHSAAAAERVRRGIAAPGPCMLLGVSSAHRSAVPRRTTSEGTPRKACTVGRYMHATALAQAAFHRPIGRRPAVSHRAKNKNFSCSRTSDY